MGACVLNLEEEKISSSEVFSKIQLELINRYQIDPRLASEMTYDFLDVLSAIDGDIDIFEKYFLH